ncbi:hypothetical protein CSUI_005226 [Cystoisospora suis]|uniref:Uncharacterized protein n=1 Tax=Cystoisospora suis TaxID=483139 RepID=A0A2C6KYD9_9APIC|nr:hypothetical protein CSUI_005226 [Cystoisospora suis]
MCYSPRPDGASVSSQLFMFGSPDFFEWHSIAPAPAEERGLGLDSASFRFPQPFVGEGFGFPSETAVQVTGDLRDILEVSHVSPQDYCPLDVPEAHDASAEHLSLLGYSGGFSAAETAYPAQLSGPSLLADWSGAVCRLGEYPNAVDADSAAVEGWACYPTGEEEQVCLASDECRDGDVPPVLRGHTFQSEAAASCPATSFAGLWAVELKQVPFVAVKEGAERSRRPSSFGTASTCGTEASVAGAALPLLSATTLAAARKKLLQSSPCSLLCLRRNDRGSREEVVSRDSLRTWAARRGPDVTAFRTFALRESTPLMQKTKRYSDEQRLKISRRLHKGGSLWKPQLLPRLPYHVQIVMLTAAMSAQGLTAYLDAARPVHYDD